MNTVFLRMAVPESGTTVQLAPRVEGRLQYQGESGWAVQVSDIGEVQVYWEDGGSDWCNPEELLFL